MGMKKAPLIEMLRSTIKIVEACNASRSRFHLLHDTVLVQVLEPFKRDSWADGWQYARDLPHILSNVQPLNVSAFL